jgi:hypothetical protein
MGETVLALNSRALAYAAALPLRHVSPGLQAEALSFPPCRTSC